MFVYQRVPGKKKKNMFSSPKNYPQIPDPSPTSVSKRSFSTNSWNEQLDFWGSTFKVGIWNLSAMFKQFHHGLIASRLCCIAAQKVMLYDVDWCGIATWICHSIGIHALVFLHDVIVWGHFVHNGHSIVASCTFDTLPNLWPLPKGPSPAGVHVAVIRICFQTTNPESSVLDGS